jgi:sulfopyruvate decarboxylase subunit alpha
MPAKGVLATLDALVDGGWTFAASVPDKGIAPLLAAMDGDDRFVHVPATREEEAIGLCAGSALAGRKGVVLMQNSGLGNAVNALTSLIAFYDLPLLIVVSQRGGPGEQIAAQIPMGRATRDVLVACGVHPVDVGDIEQLRSAVASATNRRVAVVADPSAWSRILA